MKKKQLINWKTYLVILGIFSIVQVFAHPSNNIITMLKGRNKGNEIWNATADDENRPRVQKDNRVFGKVIDKRTGEPLNGVSVIIGSHDGINEDQFNTKEDGLFLVNCDHSKRYVVLATKSSYKNESLFFALPTLEKGDTLLIKLNQEF